MGRRGRTWAIITIVLAALGDAASAHASAFGLIGHSGKQGPICNECHSGGTAPTVAFSGPDTVAVGATVTYHFSVESARAAQKAAGFNVAVSGGQLAILPDQGEQLLSSELTHTAPKPNTDNVAGWDFLWTAPSAAGAATLFGAGNSVNLNGLNSGDRASATTFAVTVVEAVTSTPTATPVPNTPVATHTRGTLGGPCAGDCNGDGTVAVNELVLGVSEALGTGGADVCPAMDGNADGQVAISELIAAVASLLDGCP